MTDAMTERRLEERNVGSVGAGAMAAVLRSERAGFGGGSAFVAGTGRRPRAMPDGSVVFLDFEASSLGKKGFPIEVAWVFETGEEESHLIRPAEGWTDWSALAEAVHRIPRDRLEREGRPAAEVARRALDALSGHRLYASAPSWDGQWLSRLLRAGGLPRHALRLRDTEEARAEIVAATLEAAGVAPEELGRIAGPILEEAQRRAKDAEPAHRALDDARWERELWLEVRRRAEEAYWRR